MVTSPKIKLFLDTSVLVSGSISRKGASFAILKYGESGILELVISGYIFNEAREIIKVKISQALPEFKRIHSSVPFVIIPEPKRAAIEKCKSIVLDPDDAPVLAAAISAKPDYFITLDRKHFINDPKVAQESGLRIVTPGKFLKLFR